MMYNRYAEVYDESGQIGFSLRMLEYLDRVLERHPPPAHSLLDLACGTGTVALAFAQRGWEVYGVDASPEMLERARAKAAALGQSVALSCQDMRRFVLPHPVALVTCLYDSLNYMLTEYDLRRALSATAQALLPGGLFVADVNTRYALEHGWGNNCFFTEGKNLAMVMDSSWDPTRELSTVHLVGFIRNDAGLYERFDEQHVEAAFDDATMRCAFASAGLEVNAVYECFTFSSASADANRLLWVAGTPPAKQNGGG
ncbi:MAG TPA: class I SAM-dependent methyltransferase [Anaerolineae bacterium]|nr:class I SAM-dependent methyltransferase [Anaerolineae bacterium]